jgi:hypothetical protein
VPPLRPAMLVASSSPGSGLPATSRGEGQFELLVLLKGIVAFRTLKALPIALQKTPGSFLPEVLLESCQTIGIRSYAERER